MKVIDSRVLSPDPLEALRELSNAGNELESLVRDRVASARRGGATWDAIGESLGMSRQAAWEYYTRDVRQALDEAPPEGSVLGEEDALEVATEEISKIRRRRRRSAS